MGSWWDGKGCEWEKGEQEGIPALVPWPWTPSGSGARQARYSKELLGALTRTSHSAPVIAENLLM